MELSTKPLLASPYSKGRNSLPYFKGGPGWVELEIGKKGIIVPAVLPCSFEDLKEKLNLFSHISGVARVQIDVVDQSFADPSWPYTNIQEFNTILEKIKIKKEKEEEDMLPYGDKFIYEIDLMCADSERAVEVWLMLGATRFTFHANKNNEEEIGMIIESVRRRLGAGAAKISFGIAYAIDSDYLMSESIFSKIDYVQFMGIVDIGKQGQLFDTRVVEKIRAFHQCHSDIPIQVDGGVSLSHARNLVNAGASDLIVGSALLKAANPAIAFSELEMVIN